MAWQKARATGAAALEKDRRQGAVDGGLRGAARANLTRLVGTATPTPRLQEILQIVTLEAG
jgi:hypothetical protein